MWCLEPNKNVVTQSPSSVYILHKPKWKEVTLMKKRIIVLGLAAIMLFAGTAFAADQTRARSKDQTRTHYQTGTQDRTGAGDQQNSQTRDRKQTRDRVKDGSHKTR